MSAEKQIMDKLSHIYCDSCKYHNISEEASLELYNNYGCSDCYRKYIGWEISEQTTKDIIDIVTKDIKEAINSAGFKLVQVDDSHILARKD